MTPHELAAKIPLGAFFAFMVVESLIRSLSLATVAGWLSRSAFGERVRVIARRRFSGQFRQELGTASLVLAFDAGVVTLATLLGVMPSAPVTLGVHVATFFAMLVWYDAWFYATHRLMHTKWLWRFHAVHHRAGVPHVLTAFSFSLLERGFLIAGTIGAAGLAALFVPVSGLGVFAYVIFNTFFNALGHCNADFYPVWLGRLGVISTTTYHALHHERGDQNYGLFFSALDALFRTRAPDWEAKFLEVKAGRRI